MFLLIRIYVHRERTEEACRMLRALTSRVTKSIYFLSSSKECKNTETL